MKKILLHVCCGPCALWPLESLRNEGYEADGLFFNPNIHPIQEFEKRKETLRTFAEKTNFNVTVMDDFSQDRWEAYGPDDKKRCEMCYKARLEMTARRAREGRYDAFTSTLFVSPYQDHELMKSIALEMQDVYQIPFLYKDFRDGFRKGQNMARDMGLYRQKYCGCIHSYNSSKFKDKITW